VDTNDDNQAFAGVQRQRQRYTTTGQKYFIKSVYIFDIGKSKPD